MPEEPTTEFIKALALANGISLPEERLEVVLQQYRTFMEAVRELYAVNIAMDAEPASIFSVAPKEGDGE